VAKIRTLLLQLLRRLASADRVTIGIIHPPTLPFLERRINIVGAHTFSPIRLPHGEGRRGRYQEKAFVVVVGVQRTEQEFARSRRR